MHTRPSGYTADIAEARVYAAQQFKVFCSPSSMLAVPVAACCVVTSGDCSTKLTTADHSNTSSLNLSASCNMQCTMLYPEQHQALWLLECQGCNFAELLPCLTISLLEGEVEDC